MLVSEASAEAPLLTHVSLMEYVRNWPSAEAVVAPTPVSRHLEA